ncbi:hypothetical protein CRG98_012107 [Punica granatum]|uniref:Uncharacterized protein n=1 Tax=Punica granatum TaxID=22663 RepID=A0A2I0KH38_PUNGR|nr:hypothetical protein CRG98_012107 [Punica granatum]
MARLAEVVEERNAKKTDKTTQKPSSIQSWNIMLGASNGETDSTNGFGTSKIGETKATSPRDLDLGSTPRPRLRPRDPDPRALYRQALSPTSPTSNEDDISSTRLDRATSTSGIPALQTPKHFPSLSGFAAYSIFVSSHPRKAISCM